jgi:hypothetical protein
LTAISEARINIKIEEAPKIITTEIIPKVLSVKISASQVWLGSYASSHLISRYIYVAYGHILASTIKTINHISTGYELRFRRDYN